MQVKILSLLRPLFLIVTAVIAALLLHQMQYLPGWILGVLAAWMNHSTLVASVRSGRIQSQRNRLTLRFFWRYLLIGGLLFALQMRGSNHLIGFLAGFAVAYASFFTEYLIRLRKPIQV